MQRCSRTVIHENTGSKSGVAGGTFSKASFSVSSGNNGPDVDIEDPDFWKKTIGEPKEDEGTDTLLTKRQRKQIKSYSEAEYLKNLDRMIGGESDSDNDVSDDNDDIDLGYSEERSKWGGSGLNEWKKSDAESVARLLSTNGYGIVHSPELKDRLMLENSYNELEVRTDVVIFETRDCFRCLVHSTV